MHEFTDNFYFGQVPFDEEDIANEVEQWETIIGPNNWKELFGQERLARYLTMTNNLWYERDGKFVEYVAGMSVRLSFIYVLLYIVKDYEEEQIVDMGAFFDHFIKYLNDNVGMIERISDENISDTHSQIKVAKSFSEYIGRVIENSNKDECRSDKESGES